MGEGAGMNTSSDLKWVDELIRSELDVRPIHSKRRSLKFFEKAAVIRTDEGNPVAYAEVVNHLKGVEITTVLVDQSHRGKGYGKELMKEVISQIDNDLIFLHTKSPALVSIIQKIGFKKKLIPSFISGISILLRLPRRSLTMIFRGDFKRLWLQTITLGKYDCYVLERKRD